MTWTKRTVDLPSYTNNQTNHNTRCGLILDEIVAALGSWTKTGPSNYGTSAAWGKVTHSSGAEFAITILGTSTTDLAAGNAYDATTHAREALVAWKPAEGSSSFNASNNPGTANFCRDAGATKFSSILGSVQESTTHKMHILTEGSKLILLNEVTVGTPGGLAIFTDSVSGQGALSEFAAAGDTKGQLSLVYPGSGTFTPAVTTPECTLWTSTAGAANLSTVGSSTTVTTTGNAFAAVVVGDTLVANSLSRLVTAKADNNNVTVNTAVNWSAGFPFVHGVLAQGGNLSCAIGALNSTVNPATPWLTVSILLYRAASGGFKGVIDPTLFRRGGTHIPAKQRLDSENYIHFGSGCVVAYEPGLGAI